MLWSMAKMLILTLWSVIMAFSHIVQSRTAYDSAAQCLEPSVENGKLHRGKKDAYYVGDVLVVTCDDIFTLLGSRRIKCMPDGRWSSNPPYCKEVECFQLQQLMNGTITPNPQTSKIGAVVDVTCEDDFILMGSQQLTCNIKGTWFPDHMPYCKEVKCPDILVIQNGTMSPAIPERPGHVNFTCEEGFTLKGPSSLSCTEKGKWTPNVMPYCYEVKCPDILVIQHGTMSPAISESPGHVNLTCDEGFTLKGPSSLSCTEEGKWTPNVMPYCYEVKCPYLLVFQNGTMSLDFSKRPGHVNFSCDEGFTLNGPSSLTCTEEGKWSPTDMPYCGEKKDHPRVLNIFGVKIKGLLIVLLLLVIFLVSVVIAICSKTLG